MAQPVPPYLPEDLILRNDSWLLSVRRVKIGCDVFISMGDIKSLKDNTATDIFEAVLKKEIKKILKDGFK